MRVYPKPLIGFESHDIIPKRVITLPLTIGVEPQTTMAMIEFVVIDVLSTYNAILGRVEFKNHWIISSPQSEIPNTKWDMRTKG